MPVAIDRFSRRRLIGTAAAAFLASSTRQSHASTGSSAPALVIGSTDYAALPRLPHAGTDAEMIAGSFADLGLDVEMEKDADRRSLMLALAQFRLRARTSDLILFYFAGHGALIDGVAHLVPTDFDPTLSQATGQAVPISTVLRAVSDRPRTKILFLDACRSVPEISLPGRKGNPPISAIRSFAPAGTHITYASEPGKVAYDGAQGASPFTLALARALQRPGQEIEDIARQVRREVVRQTGGRQIPWTQSSLLSRVTLGTAIGG